MSRSSCRCILRHWKIDQLGGLDAEAEQSHDRLMARLEKSGRVARRIAERRAELVTT